MRWEGRKMLVRKVVRRVFSSSEGVLVKVGRGPCFLRVGVELKERVCE